MQNKKQKLKDYICEQIPSILDLKFGCLMQVKGAKYPQPIVGVGYKKDDTVDYFTDIYGGQIKYNKDLKIIGRPIILEDVLMVIKNKLPKFYFSKTDEVNNSGTEQIVDRWNLGKTLTEQSDETISFLADLLLDK